MSLVIGLISGTSVDGIDAVLIQIADSPSNGFSNFSPVTEPDPASDAHLGPIVQLAALTYPYPEALKARILDLCAGAALTLAELAELDDAIAHTFAQAAQAVQAGHPPAHLIGSHGQTVYHRPLGKGEKEAKILGNSTGNRAFSSMAYSLQLGRGDWIAQLTGIDTVSNFRAADIAAGGEGAPMVPPVDAWLLGDDREDRCVQNLGGIGNVTYLPARSGEDWRSRILGWDTGPSNSLLDLAVQQFTKGEQSYDREGAWAAQGTICQTLVDQWLQQTFFHQPPPKSTGRELFGWAYLDQCWQEAQGLGLGEADFLATLTELTVASIDHSYRTFLPRLPDRILLGGGGSHNTYLRQRLQQRFLPIPVQPTDDFGVCADFKEAIAFALLAHWHRQGIPGNLPAVTGAKQAVVLGDFYPGQFHPG